MLLEVMWWLTVLTLVLIYTGYSGDEPGLSMVGFGFLFLIGMVFISGGGLQYQTGYQEQIIDVNNTIVTYTHDTYDNHTLGFFTVVISIAGFVYSIVNLKTTGGMKS